MKPRIQYEHTKQTHPAAATVRGLRKEMNDLLAHQRSFEASVRLGVEGALKAVQEGRHGEAEVILVALKGIIK